MNNGGGGWGERQACAHEVVRQIFTHIIGGLDLLGVACFAIVFYFCFRGKLISYSQLLRCRLGHPQDVTAMVRYLLSAEASYVTGQVLTIDGGLQA